MPRLGTPEVSSSHQIQPRVGQFQHPVLQFQSTSTPSSSSSPPIPLPHPVLPSSSSLPHPVLQFQFTSSSPAVPVYLIQSSSSSTSSIFRVLHILFYVIFLLVHYFSFLYSDMSFRAIRNKIILLKL